MTAHRLRRAVPGLLIALAFLLASILTLGDYGLTLDEPETFGASNLTLGVVKAALTGQALPAWTFHELPGYYFVVDLVRGAFVWVASKKLHLMDDVLGFHFVNVVYSTLAVFVFYLLARNVSGKTRIAVFSTMALVLLPQFVAHSQNNPKDLPGLFVYVLTIYTFTRLDAASKLRDVLGAGLALGLALTTSVSAIFLVPILGLWQVFARTRLRWTNLVLVLTAGAVTAFVCWPWLWTDPAGHLTWAARHILSRFHIETIRVLYFGTVYEAWDVPWHFSLLSVLAATPVLYLLLAVASLLFDRARVDRSERAPRSAAILGWLWCAIPIAAEARGPMHYDGARHLLMTAPALCLLAGVGIDAILRWLPGRSIAATTCATVALAYAGTELVRVHPYHNAYLNEVARVWLPGNAEDFFEVEYWGQSYKEGAEWLKAHAEPEADIYVGLDTAAAVHYLGRPSRKLQDETLRLFEDRTRPAYLMVITRKAMYPAALEHIVSTYEPILVIRRQKGNLLKIFSNRLLRHTS